MTDEKKIPSVCPECGGAVRVRRIPREFQVLADGNDSQAFMCQRGCTLIRLER